MPKPSPTRDRILRFLLGSHAAGFQLPESYAAKVTTRYELSARAGAAHNWVYSTLAPLQLKHWVSVTPDDGLHVLDAPAIYAWWKEVRTKPTVNGLQVADPRGAAQALLRKGFPIAITTYYAENAYQGHLFPRRLDAYVRSKDIQAARRFLVEELDAKIGGVNFRLLTGDDPLLDETIRIEREAEQLAYASLPQVIVDLMTEGGSCGEAAEMLIQKAYPHAQPRLR